MLPGYGFIIGQRLYSTLNYYFSMKYCLLLIVLVCCTLRGLAQDKGMIKGKLVDSAKKQTLSLATITVFRAKDTAIITYRLSDAQGEFKVPGIPLNVPCRAVITFSGYRVFRSTFELTTEQPQLDLGTIRLSNDFSTLDEVLVYAERPPVSVKKDTIEFNASAFKTLPTALVEDLLKKLPGVEVDKEGNLTVNGRAVNRLLVDGKEFFGGDPKVATRNLPANIIDKVQVTDDKDQLDQDPHINKADLGQVINLRLKRSIKKGWFGKMYAGAGTDERYETGGIVNLFRDTLQVSMLGYTNNLNRPGFSMSDVQRIGGFQRSGANNVSMNSDGGFSLNDISFGGTGQGIQRSTGAGVNVTNDFGKKLTLNLQYFFGHVNSQLDQLSNTQQFLKDTVITTRNTTRQESDDYNHRVGANLRWRPDSITTIRFENRLTFKKNQSERNFLSAAASNYEQLLNESLNEQHIDGDETSYFHEITYARNYKKGRAIFLGNRLSLSGGDQHQRNDVNNKFYNGQTTETILNQLRNRELDNYNLAFGFNYIEPVSKQLSLRISHLIEMFKNDDLLNSYNRDPSTGEYDVPNPQFTNGLDRKGVRNQSNAGFRWIYKKLTISPAIGLQSLRIDNGFTKFDDLRQQFTFITPILNINFRELNFSYRMNINEPRITDLQPVADNTNPLYVLLGNRDLQPTKTNSFNLNYNKFNTTRTVNIHVNFNGNFDDDAVVRERTVDNKGVQITRPVNVDGTMRLYSSMSVGKQFKFKSSWQFSLRTFMSGEYGRYIVIVNQARGSQKNWRLSPNLSWAFNWKDKFEFNQRYGIGWNKTRNANPFFQDLEVISHNSSSEVVVRMPRHWVWESSIDYTYNQQIAPGLQKSNTRWNAAVNFLFLKDDQGQLKLSVYDLLDQNISISRSTRENYIQDNQTSVLKRYFLLTFTYNIRNFGGKVGGRGQLFRF